MRRIHGYGVAMLRSVPVALGSLMLLAAPAGAVLPGPRAMLEADRHDTGGQDWHVQLDVDETGDRLAGVVVYSQVCGQTGFTQRVPLGPEGTFELVDVPLQDGTGTWSLRGAFDDVNRASGVWSMSKTTGATTCDVGGDFTAQDVSGHFLLGNPYEYAPASTRGTSRNARRLRALKYRIFRNARRFDTRAEARRLGYVLSTPTGCPGMQHARKHGTAMWGKVLDPTAPQSLVFWCDSQGRWTLAAFMYRADATTRPDTYGRMLQWHKHGSRRTSNWMTHVWLVDDPVGAFATCAPFNMLAARRLLAYEPYVIDAPADRPCSDTAGLETPPAQPPPAEAPAPGGP